MDDAAPPGNEAGPLLAALAAKLGVADDESQEALALEFVCGDHVATLFPHPGRAGWICAEVSIRGLALGFADPYSEDFLVLHRLNAAARHDHPWTICIDGEDMLLLAASFPPEGLGVEGLAENLAEGLARAESLDAIWKSLRGGANPAPETLAGWTRTPNPLQFA